MILGPIVILIAAAVHLKLGRAQRFELVTCGSAVKLKNVEYGVRLHTPEEMRYARGSRQQSVSGVKAEDEPGSLWVVKQKLGSSCQRGEPIKCGDVIILEHIHSKMNLHTHDFRSPLTNQQEITVLKDSGNGSNWKLICENDLWRRGSSISLLHGSTSVYLSVSGYPYDYPLEGHLEVVGTKKKGSDMWVDEEGFYFHPNQVDLKKGKKDHSHTEL